jgi:hypothetical protein
MDFEGTDKDSTPAFSEASFNSSVVKQIFDEVSSARSTFKTPVSIKKRPLEETSEVHCSLIIEMLEILSQKR